ncbi:MAG: TIGR01212 family radical SAM protein [Saccharofermentans sp.]|nr:TIGR01212 family radical SAM protein [Saccharofermentans sp.]
MFTANEYYKKTFGHKMYKASISINVTCPNRDGTKGTGGCIFCSGQGSGEFASDGDNISLQIDEAIARVSSKAGNEAGYIAYFQSYTNTYCSSDYLRKCINEALSHPMIEAISIATRPDCLGEDILEVLSECAAKVPLFVELGLQTSSDKTAKLINRGYETYVYPKAVRDLKAIGANVITHVILGLPGEDISDMEDTVRMVAASGSDGIKFTCLYVLKGTMLADMYARGEFVTLEMEEYFDIVFDLIKLLPDNMVIHRLTGDGPKNLLIAPDWTRNKRAVLNYMNRRFGL